MGTNAKLKVVHGLYNSLQLLLGHLIFTKVRHMKNSKAKILKTKCICEQKLKG